MWMKPYETKFNILKVIYSLKLVDGFFSETLFLGKVWKDSLGVLTLE